MGANAQTAVPAFVAGEILTASEMTQVNTGIPVFATTTTRDAAFGGTGEKVLAQGQYAYIEATSTLQVYNGSAWVTAVTSGLTYLTGGSFSAVSAVNLAANTFSATYRDYLINIQITAGTGIDASGLNWRGRTSGTDNSNANYNFALGGRRYADGIATTGGNGASATAGRLTLLTSGNSNTVTATFFGPQLTQRTSYVTLATGRGVGDTDSALQGGGFFDNTTSFDALSFYPAAGTITGTYEVYGYAIS